MNIKEIFAERLTQLREDSGLSRQKVADDLQISRASLEYYEKAKRAPDIEILHKIAEYFNTSSDYLIGRTPDKTIDIELQAVCKYTGLSEKAIHNLTEMKENKFKVNLLFENKAVEDIIQHLSEIERLEIAKRYFDLVINPIANGDEFYDNLALNNVKLCKFHCDNMVKTFPNYKQNCESCDRHIKFDKDYILELICKEFHFTLSDFGVMGNYCPEYLSEDYQDKLDLEEFKLTKSIARIVAETKENSNCSAYFIGENTYVRKELINELQELEAMVKREEVSYNNGKLKNWSEDDYAEQMAEWKAKIAAIQIFLEKYDVNFKLKKDLLRKVNP